MSALCARHHARPVSDMSPSNAARSSSTAQRYEIPLRRTQFCVRLNGICERGLQRVVVAFAGADADDVLDRRDPDLAVTDLAGARRRGDEIEDAIDVAVVDDEVDARL